MGDAPWLTIVGLGEDGPDGLSDASHAALRDAEFVIGPPRHLGLMPDIDAQTLEWPAPFADGLPQLLGLRGRQVVVLASGDPFWFGAGSVIARHLEPTEWCALPGTSAFSLTAARLGWPIEQTLTIGLHAAPLSRLRPHLAKGQRAIVLLRDGVAVAELADWLAQMGFGASRLHVMEALGGPRQRIRSAPATGPIPDDIVSPVCVGLDMAGDGAAIALATGRDDAIFETDGQITKRPMRALTLSALRPQQGEHLWDIGAGSGSIGIEWLLSHPATSASAIEPRPDRAARIRRNADALGVDRLTLVTGQAPGVLGTLDAPDAVFIGGGLSQTLLDWLQGNLASGTRIVANAVTLESEALLSDWHERLGGDLLRFELAHAAPLGSRRAWTAAFPVVQWSVTL